MACFAIKPTLLQLLIGVQKKHLIRKQKLSCESIAFTQVTKLKIIWFLMFYPTMSPCSLPRNLGIPQQCIPCFKQLKLDFVFLTPSEFMEGHNNSMNLLGLRGVSGPWSPNCCRMLPYNSLRFAVNHFFIFGNVSEIAWFTADVPPFNESKQTFKKTYFSFERKQIMVTISTSDFYIKKREYRK